MFQDRQGQNKAVSTTLYKLALAIAPATELAKSHAFLFCIRSHNRLEDFIDFWHDSELATQFNGTEGSDPGEFDERPLTKLNLPTTTGQTS